MDYEDFKRHFVAVVTDENRSGENEAYSGIRPNDMKVLIEYLADEEVTTGRYTLPDSLKNVLNNHASKIRAAAEIERPDGNGDTFTGLGKTEKTRLFEIARILQGAQPG